VKIVIVPPKADRDHIII